MRVDDPRVDAARSLIVRACLAQKDALAAAVQAIEDGDALDYLDQAALRLLPFLYRRVESEGIRTPSFPILKGIYKRAWFEYSLQNAAGVLASQELLDGIDFVVLKGVALREIAYQADGATRPVFDTDILVHPSHRQLALQRFLSAGFRLDEQKSLRRYLYLGPSAGLRRGDVRVDLHWGLYPTPGGVDIPRELLDSAHTVTQAQSGVLFHTPSVIHHALHVVVHGYGYNPVSTVRWLVDFSQLTKHDGWNEDDFWVLAERWGWSRIAYRQLSTAASEWQEWMGLPKVTPLAEARSRSLTMLFWWHRTRRPGFVSRALSTTVVQPLWLGELAGVRGYLRALWRSIRIRLGH